MGRELGGALCRTPARASATGTGSDENARPAGASDTAPLTPAPTPTASRPPLRAIQPPGQPRRAVKKGLGVSAAGKTPMRVGAVTTPLRPTKILEKPKPALRLGFSTTGASSAQVQRSKVRDSIWEENQNAQNVSSTLQQDNPRAKAEDHSDENFMRNSEDALSLQLELEITKTILVEEMKARAEAEFRATALGDELKAANLHTLEACKQKEDAEKELNVKNSVLEALDSELSSLINEAEELKKNHFQSPVIRQKRDMETPMLNSELGIHSDNDYVPYQDCQITQWYLAQIAEERKTYAEEKNKEVKLLERSIEDLDITACSLENEVELFKEEAEQQRRQREKLEVELENVRQQLLAVPSSREAESSLAFESAPLVEHPEEPGQPSSDECMQEFEHPSASVEMEQSCASEQPELFCGSAHSDQSLSVFDSEEKVPPPALESVIEVLKENELPPLAPVRLSDPVNYMNAPSDKLKRLRSRNHYEGHRTATDRRFWSIEQQDLYNFIYNRAKFSPMKWIDWDHIDSIDEFACVRERCAHLGLEQIMSYRCDWDSELIRQFYSTVHISADKSSMTWMTDGRRITANKKAWEERFGVPGSVHTAIHSQFMLDDDDKRIMYTAAEYAVGQIRGLSSLATIANKIIRTTIYPRPGKKVHGHNWNLLRHIVEQHPFDIVALIFGEIELLISDLSRTQLLYAPYIMGMIMRAFEYDGPRETRHSSYKPRKQAENVSRPPAPAVQAHVVADVHSQFEAAGHRPQGEAVQHTNGSLSSHIPAPRTSLTPSLEATTPSPPPAPSSLF